MTKKFFLLYLILTASLGPMAISLFVPAIVEIANQLDAEISLVQSTYSALFISWSFGQLLSGPLVDTFGIRKILILSALTFFIGTIICLVFESIYSFWIGRFLQGFGISGTSVLTRAIARSKYEGIELANIFSWVGTIMNALPAVFLAAGGILTYYLGWKIIFIAMCIAPLLLILKVDFIDSERIDIKYSNNKIWKKFCEEYLNMFNLLKNKDFIYNTLAGGVLRGAWFAYVVVSPIIYQRELELDERHYSYIGFITALFMTFGAIFSTKLTNKDKANNIHFFALSLLLLNLMFFLIFNLYKFSFMSLIVAISVFTFALGFITPNTTARAMSSTANSIGSASAIIGFTSMGISSLIVLISSLLHIDNFFELSILMSILIIISIVYLLKIRSL